jgi:phage tail protein X
MNTQQSNLTNEQQADVYDYATVKQFCERYPAFTEGGMRADIFNADSNGLAESGAIIRKGRKVIINVPKYFRRLESQNKGVVK